VNGSEMIYFKGIDQPLLRDGVETFRASTVITKPYVVADKNNSFQHEPRRMMDSVGGRHPQF